ncbi:MAG TPA: heavy-metal-associated domain-containing protein [Anaerolineaceae bacterium]|nr:heavy-metal-associated domain-containing protein [Anaerolineaceae bacterium]
MNTVTYTIPNISCKHCVHTISMELVELPGVSSVQGDVDSKRVTITYEAPATLQQIETTLAEIDYPVAK